MTRKARYRGTGHIACFWVVYFGTKRSKKVTQKLGNHSKQFWMKCKIWPNIVPFSPSFRSFLLGLSALPFTARLGLERDQRIVCFDELCPWIDLVILCFVKRVKSWNTMLGNQESQEPQDQLGSQLEPDQEVAAVLGTGEWEIKTTWLHTMRLILLKSNEPCIYLDTGYMLVKCWLSIKM